MRYGIHWFRRDLRVADNPALLWNHKQSFGRVVGVFFFDRKFLARPDFSPNRFQFFLETLVKLKEELRTAGSDLLCMDVGPAEALSQIFAHLVQKGFPLPENFSWNRDYEPFARERDRKMERYLQEMGVPAHTERDHLLVEPEELHNGYKVFTPFFTRWLELIKTPTVQKRIKPSKESKNHTFKLTWESFALPVEDVLEKYRKSNAAAVAVSIPPAGHQAAMDLVSTFDISHYSQRRDMPALRGTSRLSAYLKNGSITVPQVMNVWQLAEASPKDASKRKFLSELAWREFYYHILWRYPKVEVQPFQERFTHIRWENREDWFDVWKQGKTGYPIVDAGMRELKQTGWMHNRVRMVVASFLVKDLLIDWRWGEQYFMETLLDGDLAANNGSWQWIASTGVDAQPYFRIFNPVLQSKKFDPNGDYIRKFVPELSHLNAKTIHEPAIMERHGYPPPIVDHKKQRQRALEFYKGSFGSQY